MKKIILLTFVLLLFSSFAYADVTEEALSYLTFDDANLDGTTVLDVSGNFRNGTNNNNVATGVQGVINQAFNFNGNSGFVNLSKMGQWGSNSAIAFWMNRSNIDSFEYLIAQSGGSTPQWYSGLGSGANDGKIIFYENLGVANYDYTNNAWDNNAWHFVIFNKNGTSLTIWVDNNPDANITVDASFQLSNEIEIGSRASGTQGLFTGRIDEVYFINRTLNTSDRSELYNGGAGYNPFATGVTSTIDIIFKNESGYNKTNFGEGEEIYTFINWTYTGNYTPINTTIGTCNSTMYKTYVENDSVIDSNFTLCNTGCNFTTYTEEFKFRNHTNRTADFIKIDVCHEQLQQGDLFLEISCSSGRANTTISPGQYPLCSVGYSSISFNTSVCISHDKINATLSFDDINGRRKRIIHFHTDRLFEEITHIGGIDLLFNYSSYVWYVDHGHEYYRHGTKNITANCSSSSHPTLSNNALEMITIVNAPPFVYLSQVINGNGVFSLYDGALIPFARTDFQFFGTVNDDDLDTFRAIMKNSTATLFDLNFTFVNFSSINMSYIYFDSFEANPINLTVWANDSFGNESEYTILINITDIISPYCSGLTDASINFNSTYNWSVTCSDENFFSFNISCLGGDNFNYFKSGLNNASFSFINHTLANETLVCSYTYCDGHTNWKIDHSKWFVRQDKKDKSKIEFEQNNHLQKLKFDRDIDFSYKKLLDRYSFNITFDSFSDLGETFVYETSENSYYLPSNEYKGWIVDYEAKTWFDVNNPYDEFDVKVLRWNKTTWEISLIPNANYIEPKNNKKSVLFESIGELNCVSGTQTITAIIPPKIPGMFTVQTLTTPEILSLFLLFAIWICFIILTFVMKGSHGETIQLFNLIQFSISLVLALYSWNHYNRFIGFLTMAVGVVILLGKIIEK